MAKRKEKEATEATEAPVVEAPPVVAKPATKSVKKGKLPPRNKARLPRREKKARQKAAGRL